MGKIIAIDLGTTYSCIAIPEERHSDGFMTLKECPGYSVIQDKFKRLTTPSVVAENRLGQIVVGYSAKALVGSSPEPIMFAKRSMGKDVSFQLDKQGTLNPRQVSAHILRHLKKVAEERLGETVDEAVITVPAYFDLPAKQSTEKAGEDAGLKVAQIAQEPVAAALMYCVNDTRDPLMIMTYDLGGGTFDVAILEKKDGTISTDSVKAFDGDQFLGGYDFDKKLALWVIDQLKENGYALNPDDPVMFAKMLVYAEKAKIALSREEFYEFSEQDTGITDLNGNPVVIQLDITRKEFESMIEKDVDDTINLCRRAMTEKADLPLTPDQINEIVMVGGSSRIPLVARKLKTAFGKTPKLVNPDLCVALGAAILAGAKATTMGRLKLEPIPEITDMASLDVIGSVVKGEDGPSVEKLMVSLSTADGSVKRRQTTGASGGFVFEDVPLAAGDITEFALTVTSAGAEKIAEYEFSVRQTDQPVRGGMVETVTNILAKPLSIHLVDGLHEVAPVRASLPFRTAIKAKTMDTTGQIRIPILEGNTPLGEIVMIDIPKNLEVGSSVEITLELQSNYQIIGTAFVPAIARKKEVVIDIPVPPQKSLAALHDEFDHLAGLAADAKAAAGTGRKFGGAKVKRLDDRLAACKEMLEGRLPDLLRIQDCLHEIESLVREIGAGWRPKPLRSQFNQKAETADQKIADLTKKDPEIKKDGYDAQLEAIRKEADNAYGAQNAAAWKHAYERVKNLLNTLKNLENKVGGGGGGGTTPPPDPAHLMVVLGEGLTTLKEAAKDKGRYEELRDDFKEAADSLKRIDPQKPDAMNQIREWYHTKFDPLKEKVDMEEFRGYVDLETR